MKYSVIAALAVATTLVCGCSKSEKWSVSGILPVDAAGEILYLQNALDGQWVTVDSLTVGDDAGFRFEGQRPRYPEIYRLTLGGMPVYFPIDSIEDIVIDAAAKFDETALLSGSPSADMMTRLHAAINAAGANALTPETKREIAQILTENLGGIVSFYAVNKMLGNTPLFDPADKFDSRVIGGVATQFATQRPDDPRNAMLEQMVLNNRRLYSSPARLLEADETPFIELNLRDAAGNIRSLAEVWGHDKLVILNFTLLGVEASPAYNIELNRIYDKYKGRGVEIYQVGCDDDEFMWETAAKSLPWVAVYNSPLTGASNLANYNITALPTTFVISRDGNKMERVTDLSTLDSVVGRML